MNSAKTYDIAHTAEAIDTLCRGFLAPRGFTFFQFKRIYRNGSSIILATRPEYFQDFLAKDLREPSASIPLYTRQSTLYFWDESLSVPGLSALTENNSIYHGLTIISRRKSFYDCTTVAMGNRHPTPYAYYFHVLRDLQKFAELFPTIARIHIERAKERAKTTQQKTALVKASPNPKGFFLPKRSIRFRIGEAESEYITTYEALCVQLLQEGKSYKEIGSILSMAPSTVETHLKRLKTRTGLTLQEVSLRFLHPPNNGKGNPGLGSEIKEQAVNDRK